MDDERPSTNTKQWERPGYGCFSIVLGIATIAAAGFTIAAVGFAVLLAVDSNTPCDEGPCESMGATFVSPVVTIALITATLTWALAAGTRGAWRAADRTRPAFRR